MTFSDIQTCPNCGHKLTPEGRELAPEQALAQACREYGHMVTLDLRVSEAVAAELLGKAPGTLQNWAYAEPQIPFTKVRGRRTYRLADIAEMLAAK